MVSVFFVFHGGSGSSKQEYLDAISVRATRLSGVVRQTDMQKHGVVKVNVDTDLQWTYLTGIR